jgi:hypothetical protein
MLRTVGWLVLVVAGSGIEFGGNLTGNFLGFPTHPGSDSAITDRASKP